jgi:hypothetical protein
MKGIVSRQTVAQQPQGRPHFLAPARSDAPEGRESEDFVRRMAGGKQK